MARPPTAAVVKLLQPSQQAVVNRDCGLNVSHLLSYHACFYLESA